MVSRLNPEATAVTCPFTVLVDGREKAPFLFTGLTTDAADGRRPIVVTWQWAHLKTGDYTIDGLVDQVAVERKSLADLFGTLGAHRERFELEHQRLATYPRGQACVVIEASWEDILNRPPCHSQLHPKTVLRTAVSWQARYGVPWITTADRRLGEIWTFRFLEKVWQQHQHRMQHGNQESKESQGR